MIMDRKMMNSAIAFILASMCFWNCQNEKPEEGGGSTTSDADLYIECPGKVNVRTDPETGGSQVIKFIIRKSGLGAAEARIDVMTTSELRQKIGPEAASYTVIPDNAYNISVGKVEFSDTESEKSVTVTVDRSALAGLIDYAPGKFTCLPIAVTSQDASVTSDMDYVVFVFRPDDGYHFSTWNYEGISSSTDIDQAVKDWKDAGLTIPMTFDLKSTGDLTIMTGLLDFTKRIKDEFKVERLAYSGNTDRMISRVAVCGGAGSFLIGDAVRQKADLFMTGEIKYHEMCGFENEIVLVETGHYESEQFTQNLIENFLKKQFPELKTMITNIGTNLKKYL